MEQFDLEFLKKLYKPTPDSHKGQNGKLLIIGGSHLFHSASLWSLQVASKIVDMVFYSSVPENNRIIEEAKGEFRSGIVVRRADLESYVKEADCVLIGPGMVRTDQKLEETNYQIGSLGEIDQIEHEGIQSYYITKYLLSKYPKKKFVLDAGALQMLAPEWLLELEETPILTPHAQEFQRVFGQALESSKAENQREQVEKYAKKYQSVILLKGPSDVVCSPELCMEVKGGNAGMTKGGTGDVLAGLVSALNCKNEQFLSAVCGSYINKKAGDNLYKKSGFYYNSTDLANEVPIVMKDILL